MTNAQRLAVTVAGRRGLQTSAILAKVEPRGKHPRRPGGRGAQGHQQQQHGHRPSGRPALSDEANKALAERKRTMEEGLWKTIAKHESVLEKLRSRPGGAFGRASKTRKRELDDVLPGDFVELRTSSSSNSASNVGVVLPTPSNVAVSGTSQAIFVVGATGSVEVFRAPDVALAYIDFVDPKLADAASISPQTPATASTQEVMEEPFDEARFTARAQICTRIRVLQRQAETARQRLMPAFESLYLAERDEQDTSHTLEGQTLTTVEVARKLLESTGSESVDEEANSPAVLLATHQLLMSQPRRFISDSLSHRTTNLFLKRPERDRLALRDVEMWVNDCQLYEGGAAGLGAQAKDVIDGFCSRAVRAMESRKGSVRAETEPSGAKMSTMEAAWTKEDSVIFDFLRATLGERRTLQGDHYSALAMFLVKRCGLAQKLPPTPHLYDEEPPTAALADVVGLSQTQAAVCDFLIRVGQLAPSQDLTTLETEFQILFPKDTPSETAKSKPALVDLDGDRKREQLDCPIFVIDDASAQELDDGVGIEATSDPDVSWLHIVIADPTATLGPRDDVARDARKKHSSVYLVNETHSLLPQPLIEPHGLGKGTKKGLKFSAKMKLSTAEVLDVNVGLAWLKDVRVTSYDAVDQLLGSQAQDDEVRRLNQVYDIACKLEQRRKTVGGAFVAPYLRASAHVSSESSSLGDLTLRDNDGLYSISRGYPEIDIIKPSLVEAGIGPSQTKSRGMVAELMILAGRIASVYASANDLPLYFRTQAKPSAAEDLAKLERMKDDEGIVGYRDLLASGVRISAASASDVPGEHFSMGIGTLAELEHPSDDMLKGSGYVRATSPLRRYPDLVAHWQIKAALAGAKLPFDRETIRADIPRIVRMDAWHRALERSSQRFWMTMKLARVFESEPTSPLLGPLDALVTLPDVRVAMDLQARVRVQILDTGLPVECMWGQREPAPESGTALKVAVRDVAVHGMKGSVLVERV